MADGDKQKVLLTAKDPDGANILLQADALGQLKISGGGGGGGGDATAANQVIGNASLSSIDTKLSGPVPISASSLPLPTGAATLSLQQQKLIELEAINSNTLATASNQAAGVVILQSLDNKTPALVSGRQPVANLLDNDFLSWVGSTILDVSDQIWLCGTPMSATVSSYGAVMVKVY